jgi:PAP2 superfamily
MASLRLTLARAAAPHRGLVEVLTLFGLYGIYELIRGSADGSWDSALQRAGAIVEFERSLGLYVEAEVQQLAHSLGLGALLGFGYVTLHVATTIGALVWVHRRHRDRFALLRTTLVVSSALALVAYAAYPTAPPRLAGLGIADTVSVHTVVDLNSALLGGLYNPIAAVPSLHFGYALVVGIAVAALARRRTVRVLGGLYPPVMLLIIVATGNHFWFDAAAGAVVATAGWIVARQVLAAPTQAAAVVPAPVLSLSMASVPSAGPGARNANAQRQPTSSSRSGISQIVATVKAKPIASCRASAVPT